MKQVEPKFNKPRKPIVVNELTYRRRGYCNNASILLLVVVHGLHEMLLLKFLCKFFSNKNKNDKFNQLFGKFQKNVNKIVSYLASFLKCFSAIA